MILIKNYEHSSLYELLKSQKLRAKRKKDCQTLEKETPQKPNLPSSELLLAQKRVQSFYKNHRPPVAQPALNRSLSLQLNRVLEVLQNESAIYPADLPTSLLDVERDIALYMSKLLQDVPSQKCDIDHIQALLRAYKVVRLLPSGKLTVSLEAVYSILQDRYLDSSLCGLLNILMAGWGDVETKVITFH